MFKSNKISALLVAAILMLSVYYLRKPIEDIPGDEPSDSVGIIQERDSRLQTTRDQIDVLREEQRYDLMVILGNSTSSIQEKETAMQTMKELDSVIEKELILESKVVQLGFSDSLVYASEEDISVTVISPEETIDVINQIFSLATIEFGTHYGIKVNTLLPI